MRFSVLVLIVLALLWAGCAGTPDKKPTGEGPKAKTLERTPTEEPKEEQKKELDEKVGKAIRLWEEFYKKRLIEREFDYALLVRAIEALESARADVRAALALSPSDERLRDFSSRIETKLSKLKEEKIAYDLEEKAKKETEQLMRQAVEGEEKEVEGKSGEEEKEK